MKIIHVLKAYASIDVECFSFAYASHADIRLHLQLALKIDELCIKERKREQQGVEIYK